MSHRLLFWDVDTQVDFMHPEGKLYVSGAETRVGNLKALTRAAREHGLPVIASADDHEPGDAEISDTPDWSETFPQHCMRGTPGAERIEQTQRDDLVTIGHEALGPEALDALLAGTEAPALLILKKRFDVFTNPNTEALLERLAPARIVLYGVATDVCNRHAIEGLLERGFGGRLAMVEDAVRAIDEERVPELLADWRSRGVEMITTAEALDRATAGRPATHVE